jgi:hypothetical protein
VAKAVNPRFGVVYEIGWQRQWSDGVGHPLGSRRIYVFRDRKGEWHFLGEGPEEDLERGQGRAVEATVDWKGVGAGKLPLKIRFVLEIADLPYGEGDPRTDSFVTYEDSVLAGPFPAQLAYECPRYYLLAKVGDTFDQLVGHCADWEPGRQVTFDLTNEADRQERERIESLWRTALAELNPGLPRRGAIKAGTRVWILDYGEVVKRLEALKKRDPNEARNRQVPLVAVAYDTEDDFVRGVAPPIADADPVVRHTVELRVPTAMQVEKHGKLLRAKFLAFVTTNVTVGYKMETGIAREDIVLRDGIAHSASRELSSDLSLGPDPWVVRLDMPALAGPGREFSLEHRITVFETDMPSQHWWSPESGKHYQVLWDRTFSAHAR